MSEYVLQQMPNIHYFILTITATRITNSDLSVINMFYENIFKKYPKNCLIIITHCPDTQFINIIEKMKVFNSIFQRLFDNKENVLNINPYNMMIVEEEIYVNCKKLRVKYRKRIVDKLLIKVEPVYIKNINLEITFLTKLLKNLKP